MRPRLALILAASLWTMLGGFLRGQSDTGGASRTTRDQVYSREQAREGRTLFYDVCIACHADPFWKAAWRGRPVNDLYTTIRRYMPDDNPGTLSARESAAALAYIFESNGMPAGPDPLPDDPRSLADIVVADPPSHP